MVDRTALEMRSTRKCTGGSNPSLSATDSVLQDRLVARQFLQRQFAAFAVEILESIEAIPASN